MSIEQPKSMDMFFIDNRAQYTPEAVLAGDLILAPDDGKYPRAIPVASATHPAFKGRAVVLAGTRTLIVALIHGAKTDKDIQRIMSAMPQSAKDGTVQQFAIGLDSIIHRVVTHVYEKQEGDVVPSVPLGALLKTLAADHPTEAANLVAAIKHYTQYGKGDRGLTPAVWESVSDMAQMIEAAGG